MAVTRSPQYGTAAIKVQTGTSAAGTPQYKTVNFTGLKAEAVDQDVYDTLHAFAELQSSSIAELLRTDKTSLINA